MPRWARASMVFSKLGTRPEGFFRVAYLVLISKEAPTIFLASGQTIFSEMPSVATFVAQAEKLSAHFSSASARLCSRDLNWTTLSSDTRQAACQSIQLMFGHATSSCLSLKTRSDCRSNRPNAVFRGVAIEFGRCLQQARRISVTDETFGHELTKSPRGPIQCVIATGGFPDKNVEGLSNAALITADPWNETQYFSI